MATEETNCASNFYLPRGPQGPIGDQGLIGPQGYAGNPQLGAQGPSGASKIDININYGIDPYMELLGHDAFFTLAHFIFPGTNDFTPQTWRIAVGYFSSVGSNVITINLGYITDSGSKVILGTREINTTAGTPGSGLEYSVEEISNLGSFPAGPTNCFVEAKATQTGKGNTTRFYATELRG